jgi:F420-0:gamma-glutamyl ligase
MQFIPIKTRKFTPPQDKGQLFELLAESVPDLKDKDVVVITSKIVSIHQGRFVKVPAKNSQKFRLELIKKEAEAYFSAEPSSMTIKEHTLTPYAGIDRSNANGHYILFPKSPQTTAKKIWQYLRKKHKVKNLGIIIADSTCHPLRWGQFGISLGGFGFKPVYRYGNQTDIFGRKLKNHNQNIVDALAAIGVIHLGEGGEQTPLLIIRGFSRIEWSEQSHLKEFWVDPKADLYSPLLRALRGRSR